MTEIPSTWPDRIHYVCNAGSAAIVNLSPIAHAGPERITGMTILCGVATPGTLADHEWRNAILPARRLKAYMSETVGLAPRSIRQIERDPDSHLCWADALTAAQARAEAENATLVYNVSTGLRGVTFGALLGCPPEVRARIKLVTVAQRDRRCLELGFDAKGRLDGERLLPVAGGVGLDAFLAAYGLREIDPGLRRDHEAFLDHHTEIANRLFNALRKERAWAGLAALHRWATAADDRANAAAAVLDLSGLNRKARPGAARLLAAASGVEGLEIVYGNDGSVASASCTTVPARRFIGGLWMEAYVRGRLLNAIGGRNDVGVRAGLRLTVDTSSRGAISAAVEDSELDLVVMIDDQPHIVEVKAVQSATNLGDALARLAQKKLRLSGPQGRAWLLAPVLDPKHLDRHDFVSRARASGITLLAGRPALDRFVGEIQELLGSGRTT